MIEPHIYPVYHPETGKVRVTVYHEGGEIKVDLTPGVLLLMMKACLDGLHYEISGKRKD